MKVRVSNWGEGREFGRRSRRLVVLTSEVAWMDKVEQNSSPTSVTHERRPVFFFL